jgi:hypothetical protein
MPSIIDGSGSATFQTPLPLAQGGSGNTTGNVVSSQVADAFNATGSAPLFACRAWVNFNGTGTVAIRASGNVSSITDNGTGDYTVNFATAMVDANYSLASTSSGKSGVESGKGVLVEFTTVPTSSLVRIGTIISSSGVLSDGTYNNVSIFR